jgi:uncharacterized membrane protein YqjE
VDVGSIGRTTYKLLSCDCVRVASQDPEEELAASNFLTLCIFCLCLLFVVFGLWSLRILLVYLVEETFCFRSVEKTFVSGVSHSLLIDLFLGPTVHLPP